MSATYKYILDFVGNNRQLIGAIDQNTKSLAVMDKKAEEAKQSAASAFSSMDKGSNKLLGSLGSLAAGFGIAFSAGAVLSFAKSTTEFYNDSIQAETSLLVALKGRKDVQQRLIDQATELMHITLFDDDEIVRAQSLVAAFVKEESQIKKVIPAIMDYAAAKQIDLASATDMVTRTLAGEMDQIGRTGIKVEGAAGSAARLTSIVKGLNEAYGGQAEAAAKVGTAALTQLSHEYGNLKEAVGKLIIEQQNQQGSFTKMLAEDTKAITGFLNKVSELNDVGSDTTNSVLTLLLVKLGFVSQSAVDARIAMGKLNGEIEIAEGVKITKSGEEVKTYSNSIEGLTDKLKDYNDELKKIDLSDNKAISAKIAQIVATEKQIKLIDELKKKQEAAAAIASDPMRNQKLTMLLPTWVGNDSVGSSVKSAEKGFNLKPKLDVSEMQKNMPLFQKNMEFVRNEFDKLRQKQEAVRDAFASGFEAIGQSVMSGLGLAANGIEGFLGKLGETVIKLVSMMLAESLANAIAGATASGAATGPGAIFTTPAFIATAIGGVLAAFAAIPKFADGGIVYGPTMGLMGEYPGASSNPEIIAPLSKLQAMIGGGGSANIILQPGLDFDGDKLRVFLKRLEAKAAKRNGN